MIRGARMVKAHRGELQARTPAVIRRLERLQGVLPYRVFQAVEHFSGLTGRHLAALLDVREARISGAVAQLNRGEDERAIADALARFNETVRFNESKSLLTIFEIC